MSDIFLANEPLIRGAVFAFVLLAKQPHRPSGNRQQLRLQRVLVGSVVRHL